MVVVRVLPGESNAVVGASSRATVLGRGRRSCLTCAPNRDPTETGATCIASSTCVRIGMCETGPEALRWPRGGHPRTCVLGGTRPPTLEEDKDEPGAPGPAGLNVFIWSGEACRVPAQFKRIHTISKYLYSVLYEAMTSPRSLCHLHSTVRIFLHG